MGKLISDARDTIRLVQFTGSSESRNGLQQP
jgi:hypothetical protein